MSTASARMIALALLLAATASVRADAPGLDAVLLVDGSRSMAPAASRTRALARRLVDLLARDGDVQRLPHRLAVIAFGARPRVVLQLTDVATAASKPLDLTLAADEQKGTDILAALNAGNEMLRELPPQAARRRVLVLVTDGRLDAAHNGDAAYRRQLANFTTADAALEILLVCGQAGPPAPDEQLWRRLAGDGVHVTGGNDASMLAAVHATIARLTGSRFAESASNSIVIPPYLSVVVFDVFRGPSGGAVAAFPPGASQPINDLRGDETFTTLVVPRPAPGRWTFRMTRRNGRVRVFSQQFFPRGLLTAPAPETAVHQFEQLAPEYQLVGDDGMPLSEVREYPLRVAAELVRPDGSHAALQMRRSGGVFRGASVTCDTPGRYWTDVHVETQDAIGQTVEVYRDQWSGFSVAPAPRPTAGAKQMSVGLELFTMSLADRLGLPHELMTALILLTIVFALAPYFAGLTLGTLQVPRLRPRARRLLRILGPLSVAAAVALVVPVAALAPQTTRLKLLAADFVDGNIDVAIANAGTSDGLVTGIELEVLADRGGAARPALPATARYQVPIDDLQPGGKRRIVVRHLIPAGATERLLISPETARLLDVRLRIHTAGGTLLTADVPLFATAGTDTTPGSSPPAP
jgi:Mg-chelatase subunit ChlD